MGTFKMTFLACDRCGEEYDGMERLATALREQAAEDGWSVNRHGGGFDVCAACLKALDEERSHGG